MQIDHRGAINKVHINTESRDIMSMQRMCDTAVQILAFVADVPG